MSDQVTELMEKRMRQRLELADTGAEDDMTPQVQYAIQESCREAEAKPAQAEAEAKEATDDEFNLELEEYDRFFEEVDPNETQENESGEPDSTEDARNNNKQQVVAKQIDRAQAMAEEAENPEQANLDNSTSEQDNRRTEFFPAPQSQYAREARREDLRQQLNVHDLTSEFPRAMAGVLQIGNCCQFMGDW